MMRESVRKANEALLEGDRDAVLRYLEDESDSDPQVLWLKAHAAKSDEERLELLRLLSNSGGSIYQQKAVEILVREERFENQLSEPPDYQFWKQSNWKARREKMRLYRSWFIGWAILAVMIIFAIFLTIGQQNQNIEVATTQTAMAFSNQRIANYASGSLQILRVEYPTRRGVTFGETDGEQYVLATPAAGSRFVAVNIRFTCNIALCSEPPEANVVLQLNNGQVITYATSSRPFLVDQPAMSRIALGQSTDGWLVFEVPNSAVPDALLIYSSEQEPPQLVDWPAQ